MKAAKTILGKLARSVLWLAHALTLPVSLDKKEKGKSFWDRIYCDGAKLATYAAFYFLVPLLQMTFPRVEKRLGKEGLPPETVQQLAPGKKIHIMGDDLAGKAAVFSNLLPVSVSTPFRWASSASKLYNVVHDPNVLAFTRPTFGGLLGMVFNDRCFIYMKSSQKDLERQLILMHEIRHCSDAQKDISPNLLKEADATYEAVRALARVKPDHAREIVLSSYFQMAASHDAALYINAKLKGSMMPSADEMEAANREARQIVFNMVRHYTAGAEKKPDSPYLRALRQGKELSFWARKRVELVAQALEAGYIDADLRESVLSRSLPRSLP